MVNPPDRTGTTRRRGTTILSFRPWATWTLPAGAGAGASWATGALASTRLPDETTVWALSALASRALRARSARLARSSSVMGRGWGVGSGVFMSRVWRGTFLALAGALVCFGVSGFKLFEGFSVGFLVVAVECVDHGEEEFSGGFHRFAFRSRRS